jgi:hypothetical protein
MKDFKADRLHQVGGAEDRIKTFQELKIFYFFWKLRVTSQATDNRMPKVVFLLILLSGLINFSELYGYIS